jgi:type IV pilus assembly protein PilA
MACAMHRASPMKNKSRRGFTLIEIMVVVVLIGFMLCIAVPNLMYALTSARANTCIGNLRQIESACQQFATVNSLAPGSTVSVTNDLASYMKSIPVCPSGGSYYALPVGNNPQSRCTLDAAPYSHRLF